MKKALAIVLAMALLSVVTISVTMSYFTDTEFRKNTMTVGKVGISQTINGDDTNGINAKLLPVVIKDGVKENAVAMEVKVTLDVTSEAAYVRTVFAFEMMLVDGNWVDPVKNGTINYDGQALTEMGVMVYRNSTGYSLDATGATEAFAIYVSPAAKLEQNSAEQESMKQIWLASTAGNEFSDTIGGSYEILVVSQAVQAEGFSDDAAAAFAAAFPNAEMATWFK